MKKISLWILVLGCVALGIGGLGDQFLPGLMPNHIEFLGNPSQDELFFRTQALIMKMLKVLGGGLMSASVACLFFVRFGVLEKKRWGYWGIVLVTLLSEGFNLWGMYTAGSMWQYPASVLFLIFFGLGFYGYLDQKESEPNS